MVGFVLNQLKSRGSPFLAVAGSIGPRTLIYT